MQVAVTRMAPPMTIGKEEKIATKSKIHGEPDRIIIAPANNSINGIMNMRGMVSNVPANLRIRTAHLTPRGR